jgi:hypothetical protein
VEHRDRLDVRLQLSYRLARRTIVCNGDGYRLAASVSRFPYARVSLGWPAGSGLSLCTLGRKHRKRIRSLGRLLN